MSGHAVLAQRIFTPICLDESILSAEIGGRRDRPRRVLDRQHQGGPSRRLPRGGASARRVPRRRRAGVVRRHARDRASVAPRTSRSPHCRASPCPATPRAPTATSRPTSPSRSSSKTASSGCRKARVSACGRSRRCSRPRHDRSRWCVRQGSAQRVAALGSHAYDRPARTPSARRALRGAQGGRARAAVGSVARSPTMSAGVGTVTRPSSAASGAGILRRRLWPTRPRVGRSRLHR